MLGMNNFDEIIKWIDINVILCLGPIIVVMLLVESFFNNRLETKRVLAVVRWIIILYGTLSLIRFIGAMTSNSVSTDMGEEYTMVRWLMIAAGTLLPLSLLLPKFSSNHVYLLFVSIFMKIGWYIEQAIIIITSSHRDMMPEHESILTLVSKTFGIIFLQGFLLALLALFIAELLKKEKLGMHE